MIVQCTIAAILAPAFGVASPPDTVAALQIEAASQNTAEWGHWGPDASVYSSWKTHSNRLIPAYTFGLTLDSVRGQSSVYRNREKLKTLFGFEPTETFNPNAEYFDQTDIYRLQMAAANSGKKRIILFVFDGMDWQTTYAAAIAKSGRVAYDVGRGEGLAFLDYRGVETDFGYFVTTPHNDGTNTDVDSQSVVNAGGKVPGGFNPELGGDTPWANAADPKYPLGKGEETKHAYTDSASSATSMMAGIKTYNGAINVDYAGREVLPIGRQLQADGFAIGVVTSVPLSHATPACAYANNVRRSDYQDIARDLVGRSSVFHPDPLPGVDVLIGCGWQVNKDTDRAQGQNYLPGGKYMADEDIAAINLDNGGPYVVAERTTGKNGSQLLANAVTQAKRNGNRLFGLFGRDHLPFQTADGNYDPVVSFGNPEPAKAEEYDDGDLTENVTLREMAVAAVDVLEARSDQWWLLVEAGDVDWANHSNNIDNSIGAVHSGDDAFTGVVEWIEAHGGWDDTVLILTADHGHYFHLTDPDAFVTVDESDGGRGGTEPSNVNE